MSCCCMQLTFEELKTAVNAGAETLAALQELTGVATGCGRCKPQVTTILAKHKKRKS